MVMTQIVLWIIGLFCGALLSREDFKKMCAVRAGLMAPGQGTKGASAGCQSQRLMAKMGNFGKA